MTVDRAKCKVCGKEIWGEGWDSSTGRRYYSHVHGGEERHEDGSWVQPEGSDDLGRIPEIRGKK